MTGTRLDPILERVRERAADRRLMLSVADLRKELEPDPSRGARFVEAIAGPELAIIAEYKCSSPSAGAIRGDGGGVAARVAEYAAGGADALSILTERDHFDGSPGDLAAAAAAPLPRLRKDFLLDEGMVLESVAWGADAVLLMAVCLPDPLLAELREVACEAGLAVLLEVHDEAELERAAAVDPDVLGVNARDLKTFEVDLATVERLVPLVPAGMLSIAESGVRGLPELRRVACAGASGALVGEALMRSDSPADTLRAWKEGLRA